MHRPSTTYFQDIRRGALAALAAVVLLFLYTFFLGYRNVFDWHNIRSGLFLWLMLSFTAAALGSGAAGRLSRCLAVTVLPVMAVFSYILVQGHGEWGVDFDILRPYFFSSYSFAVILALLQAGEGRGRFWKYGSRLLSGILLFGIFLATLVYLVYYLHYGAAFATEDMLPVVQTYWTEAIGYLRDQIGLPVVAAGVLVLVLLLAGALRFLHGSAQAAGKIGGVLSSVMAFLALAAACYFLVHWAPRVFPVKDIRWARDYIDTVRAAEKNHQQVVQKLTLTHGAGEALPARLPGTVIFVIGESENRDHMKAFNPAYPVDTTPWLTQMAGDSHFYLYKNAYSNFTQTTPSLEMALTSINQYTKGNLAQAYSILDVAKAAGYDTWWISNQSKTGDAGTPQGLMAEFSDHQLFTDQPMGDDRKLLDLLRQVPTGGSHFIVLHMAGSHVRYSERIPKGYQGITTPGASRDVQDYDNTVYYTDHVLQDLFTYARDNLNLHVFLYSSDHGEDMVYSHGAGKFTYAMARIPVFLYLSPAYEAAYGKEAAALRGNQDKIFTNDLLFDTWSGLLHAETDQYQQRFDLSSPGYHLAEDQAVTRHGSVKIAEDPDLRR